MDLFNRDIFNQFDIGILILKNGDVEFVNDYLNNAFDIKSLDLFLNHFTIEDRKVFEDEIKAGLEGNWIFTHTNSDNHLEKVFVQSFGISLAGDESIIITLELIDDLALDNQGEHQLMKELLTFDQLAYVLLEDELIVGYNQRFRDLFYIHEEDLMKKNIKDIIPAEFGLDRFIDSEKISGREFLVRINNLLVQLVVDVEVISKNRRRIKILSFKEDSFINHIASANENLKLIVRNFDGGMFRVNEWGYYTFADGGILDLFGLKSTDVIGKHYKEYLKPYPESMEAVRRCLNGEKNVLEFSRAGRFFQAKHVPIFEKSGGFSVITLLTDITDLKEAKLKLDLLVQNIEGSVYKIDSDGYFSYAEGSLLSDFGLTSDDVVGQHYLYHLKDFKESMERAKGALKGIKGSNEFMFKNRFYHVNYMPFLENDGDYSVISVMTDITDLKETHNKLDYLLKHFDGSIYKIDSKGTFTIAEGGLFHFLGVDPKDLIGKKYYDFKPYQGTLSEALVYALAGQKSTGEFELDGRYFQISHTPLVEEDGSIFVGGMLSDITKVKTLQDELSLEKNYLQTTLNSINEGLVTLNNDLELLFINSAANEILMYNTSSNFSGLLQTLISDFNVRVGELKEGNELQEEVEYCNSIGQNYVLQYSFKPIYEDSKQKGYVLVVKNLTEERMKEKELHMLSSYDHLTGVRNRRSLEEHIAHLESKMVSPIAVVIGDINGLKEVNERHGHQEGDRLLLEFSEFFTDSLGKGTLIGRWGGDEFLAILPCANYDVAQKKMESMKLKLSKNEYTSRYLNSSNISFGIAAKTDVSDSLLEVISKAETSMFGEKLFNEASIHHNLLNTMLNALYEKNDETSSHCNRLNNYCQMIASRLELNHDQRRELHLVSLLHDIGKLGVPDRVLNKKKELDDQDWSYIKKHPEIGFQLLNTSKEMAPIADYVLKHHERFDGQGYPFGLSGHDIPLVVRIITIVDSFDAMVSKRIYKGSMPVAEALDELRRNKGLQFDPELVDVFVDIISNDEVHNELIS